MTEAINSSYVNAYDVSSLSATSVERLASGQAINSASDDPSGLAISDQLRTQKSVLTQTIENSNSGIAMSQIAQGGMKEQANILSEIQTLSIQALNGTTSQEGREAIAQQISDYVDQYEQIAETTRYNDQTLLKAAGDVTDDLSIVGEEEIILMSKADTTSISDSLRTFLGDFATNRNSMENMLNTAKLGETELASFASDFGSASNALESSVRNAMTAETNTASARSTILSTDYSKEVSDFSKSNLLTQIGYLMQTQANAHQQRNISLLS